MNAGSKTTPICVLLHPDDNVAVMLEDGQEGQTVEIKGARTQKATITLRDAVRKSHKVAVAPIEPDKPVIKFGQVIGISSNFIHVGEHVHTHNVKFPGNLQFAENNLRRSNPVDEAVTDALPGAFTGYLRRDGRAGIRNYIVVLSASNCSATVVKRVASHFSDTDLAGSDIDGIVPVTYGGGCALGAGGPGYDMLNRTLAGWLDHPNVVAALVIGLGCEVINAGSIMGAIQSANTTIEGYCESFNIQDVGGTRGAISRGTAVIDRFIATLPKFRRETLPVSLLTVGLNCGGSDGASAITANPALGAFSDMMAAKGGTVVFAEFPESHGAENYLINRVVRERDKQKLRSIAEGWTKCNEAVSVDMNNNLSTGNMEGGLSTILEKSLGAVVKGGSGPITQVLEYAERITERGIVFMDTPGFDPVSVTGLAAGGCNVVAFTTGRGSVYGCSIAPTVKISTNTELYRKLSDDMDIDAGKIMGPGSIGEVGEEIYRFVIDVANGSKTCSERHGIGWEEFVPWSRVETL